VKGRCQQLGLVADHGPTHTPAPPPVLHRILTLTEYSHSRISNFENCKRQFRFRYIDEVKSDRESIEAYLGKRVHEILERL
jgi:hypothetical protein